MAKNKSSLGSRENNSSGKEKGTLESSNPYIVLARKYRPQTFNDLIGQETMVRTLRNAFALGRIAQGYMLTGVRGVGKTTTARILARALNYETDTVQEPSMDMDTLGRHCLEIMESRHPDVIEMDAASNTGVDNIREVIESSKYKPILARAKVFIIDEVHMLSKGAFNALLKTLEEPPEHVKFIFATTEIRKVPVTVLSRCQRFDLRRVEIEDLASHLSEIAQKEKAIVDPEALTMIARAAGGSVRDALSILDQAITLGSGKVSSQIVREMLGLADRGRIFDLIESVFGGKPAETLEIFANLYLCGVEPGQVLVDLLETIHLVTRSKVLDRQSENYEWLSEEDRRRVKAFADRLSIPLLSRAWQLLFKGLEEVQKATNTKTATEMILIRLCYVSDLPPPKDIMKALSEMGSRPVSQAKSKPESSTVGFQGSPTHFLSTPSTSLLNDTSSNTLQEVKSFNYKNNTQDNKQPLAIESIEDEIEGLNIDEVSSSPQLVGDTPPVLNTFSDIVALAGERRDARLRVHLEEHVSLVKFDPIAGSIDLFLLDGAPPEIANELREKLNRWTGRRWVVLLSKTKGDLPIAHRRREQQEAELEVLRKHPAVSMLLKAFPNATVVSVKRQSSDETEETGTG